MNADRSLRRIVLLAGWITLCCNADAAAQLGGTLCPVALPPATWTARVLGTPDDERVHTLALDEGLCSIYVAGETFGALDPLLPDPGYDDGYLARYSTDGSLVWLIQVGTTDADDIDAIAVGSDHSIYVAGNTFGMMPGSTVFNLGLNDIWIAKYDQDGVQQWIRQLGSPGNDIATNIAVSASDEIFVLGTTTGSLLGLSHAGGIDYFLGRYDTSGNLLMLVQRGTSSDDYARGLAIGPGGNAWVVGTRRASSAPRRSATTTCSSRSTTWRASSSGFSSEVPAPTIKATRWR